MLTLCLMGLMFFKAFYIKQLDASRLARGSVLAYSMVGCENELPKDWIGVKDRVDFTVSAPGADSRPATGENQNKSASSGNQDANGFLSGLGLTGDGKGVLNPITNLSLAGKVKLTSKQGLLSSERTIFKNDIAARSFVTCGDPIRAGSVPEVLSNIKDAALSLVHF